MTGREHLGEDIGRLQRPDEADTRVNAAIIVDQTARAQFDCRAPGAGVDHQFGIAIHCHGQRPLEHNRLDPVFAIDGQEVGHRSGAGMGVDGLAVGDREAFGTQGFEAHFIGPAGDCAFDPGRQQALEGLEQDVLHGNGERQHPVEEGRDGRKLVLEPAVTVEQRQAGGCFELPERTAIDLAAHQ